MSVSPDLSAPIEFESAADVERFVRDAVQEAFRTATASGEHEPGRLSLSGLGGCTRKAAYAVAGVEPSDQVPVTESRAANLGTWEHEGLLPLLAEQVDGDEECSVTLTAAGVKIPGRLDLRCPGIVADLKTVGEHRLGQVRRTMTPYPSHLAQVRGYGLADLQAGSPVRWLVWIYMDRANGDFEVLVEPFTNDAALSVIDRVKEIRGWAADPDMAPRGERGPGLSLVCDECEWLTRCWGEDATPGVVGPQIRLAHDDPTTVAALRLYADAAAAESAARADKEFAKAILDGKRFGEYPPYRYNRDRDGEMPDMQAIRRDFEKRGEALPMMPRKGAIRVKVIAPAKESKPRRASRKGAKRTDEAD